MPAFIGSILVTLKPDAIVASVEADEIVVTITC